MGGQLKIAAYKSSEAKSGVGRAINLEGKNSKRLEQLTARIKLKRQP